MPNLDYTAEYRARESPPNRFEIRFFGFGNVLFVKTQRRFKVQQRANLVHCSQHHHVEEGSQLQLLGDALAPPANHFSVNYIRNTPLNGAAFMQGEVLQLLFYT